MKSSIILGTDPELTQNGFRPIVEIAQIADEVGIDVVTLPEHLAMTNNMAEFIRRYGENPPVNSQTAFAEPMVFLSAVAAVTKRVTLATSIILSPLRTGLSMAKQMATLDYMSGGRTIFGLGAGWQKEEFAATDMPWPGRHRHLFEQVQAFRELWSKAPASFHGEFINFDDLNCLPFPAQGRDVPLLLGIEGNDRNIERMADLGVGWMPMGGVGLAELVEPISKLKTAYRAKGHDAGSFEISAFAEFSFDDDGRPDLQKSLDLVERYQDIGVTMLIFAPSAYCPTVKDYAPVLERIVRAVGG